MLRATVSRSLACRSLAARTLVRPISGSCARFFRTESEGFDDAGHVMLTGKFALTLNSTS